MQFRPCIDIHNGKVKQIVGSSLLDSDNPLSKTVGSVVENFVSDRDAEYYARLYMTDKITGGHIILLNKVGTDEYELSKEQGIKALKAYPGGLQIGGGINISNAKEFIDAGASHIIVTSYVFNDGMICYNRLDELVNSVGKKHIVLDLSCRRRQDDYFVVTDRWQKFTDEKLDVSLLTKLSKYCDEFLIHAVDVEGKVNGIEVQVVKVAKESPIPVTYAGGVSSLDDIGKIKELSCGRVNVTVGSALNIFGGSLDYKEVISCIQS